MLDQITKLADLLKDPSLLATQAYLAGDWVDADDGATFDVTNPARGDVIASVADLTRAETARAIAAAETAQKEWAARTAKERANILRKWYELMVENADDLGTILTAEQGKPFAEAKGEGVKVYQASYQGSANAHDQLDRFYCLHVADHARQHSEHSAFGAAGNHTGFRRLGKHAAVTGTAQLGSKY